MVSVGSDAICFARSMGDKDIDIVAVNDITETKTLAHLLKYDSVLGNLEGRCHARPKTALRSMAKPIKVFKERDPGKIDWPSLGVGLGCRVHRTVHECRRCEEAYAGFGEEGHYFRSGKG